MQYTLRNIPDYLDAALRTKAREQGKSLNEVAVLALVIGAGLGESSRKKRDLSDIAGTWNEDPAFANVIAEQDTVDESMWH
jgi:plasmid stability protein